MADSDDEPTKRGSHFNEQRASLRSETSHGSSNARSRSTHQSPLSQRLSSRPDRADSETLPSPAPVVPGTRATTKSRTRAIEDRLVAASGDNLNFLSSPPPDAPLPVSREEHWRAKLDNESSASNLPQTSKSKSRDGEPRTPTKSPRRLSLFARSNLSTSPRSQHNITALPIMANDAPQLSAADRFHASQPTPSSQRMSRLVTEVYTVCFLIFFAIWGSLARLGLQALTFYPGAPVVFSELWANVAGTFIMGFLAEDMRLFRDEWGHQELKKQRVLDRKTHGKAKKTIPLYIGLTTGFCGSFTSFSSFARDVFLGLSNDLPAPVYHPTASPSTLAHRHAGYSVMALLGVILVTVALCLCALKAGAHLAAALDSVTPTLPFAFTRRVSDPLIALLGVGSWIAAVLLASLPPHTAWRGQALFAAVLAPLGCLARYYASLALNAINPSFPLGTFVCNVFGTAVLGMAYDLQRVSIRGAAGGSLAGCQVLQGVGDGFCGALTTVSTWMLELDALSRRHAYVYGASSVVAALSVVTVVMGSVRWSVGWEPACAISNS